MVCGSKYLVRAESARDHVDLLASSRHWPPIYIVDMATPVALCADLSYPELTSQMWGRNQGCFSSPTEPPVVSALLLNKQAAPSPGTSPQTLVPEKKRKRPEQPPGGVFRVSQTQVRPQAALYTALA